MRFNQQAFQATVKPISAEQSRANLAGLVAGVRESAEFVSIEHEFEELASEFDADARIGAELRWSCA
jgi:hypothetical protein